MGYEFIANLNGDKNLPLDKIAKALCSTNHYVLEECSSEVIALRFSYKERQPDWPEDFRLCYDEGKLLLTIHGSTRQERVKLIGDVERVLNKQGMSLTFEEI